jgi:flagellar motor switch protein FliM
MQNLQGESDNRWSRTLKEEAKNIEIELVVELPSLAMSMEDIMHMEKGDIIPIDKPELVTVRTGEIPLLHGKLGVSNNKKAVKVEEILKHPAYPDKPVDNTKEWNDE